MERPFLKVRLGGTDVWIETDEHRITEPAPQRTSAEEQAEKAMEVGERLTATIRAYCEMLVETFQGLQAERRPNKVTAAFGIKLSGEGNVYIVKSGAEASLTINAEWTLK